MNTTAQVKQAVKKSAQQIRQEPLELLKNVARQVNGEELKPPQHEQSKADSEIPKDEVEYKKKIAEQEGRQLQALESELSDIRRQKLFNSLMQRIQNGEDVPLEEFRELSFEQKDVLKAQMEAVKKQQDQRSQAGNSLPEPAAKRGRRMGGGQKGAAKKEQTRVEKPVPPSG